MAVSQIELPVQRVAAGRNRFPRSLSPLSIRGVTFANRLFFAPMGVDLAAHSGGMSPALSADGSRLLYVFREVEGFGARLRDLKTGIETTVVRSPGFFRARLSPDGSMLAYNSTDKLTETVIHLVSSAGGDSRKLCDTCGLIYQWTRDAKRILYRTGNPMRFYTVDAGTGHTVTHRVLIGLSPDFHKTSLREYAQAVGTAVVWLDPRVAAENTLLSSFLSRHTNRRTDGYGGSQAARARMVAETVRAVRRALGEGVVLALRIGIDDGLGAEGLVPDDLAETIPLLEEAGVDLFEASFYVADTFSHRLR